MHSSEHLAEDEQAESTLVSEDAQNIQQVPTEQESLPPPPLNEEAIRQGLIYPPPPDFYIRMPEGPQPPPPTVPHTPTRISTLPPGTDQQIQKSVSHSPIQLDSPYSAPQVHASYIPTKPSYMWVWMLITGLAILIFGSCALALWLGYSMFGSPVNYDANAIGQQQIDNYYGAIQTKNYIQAYSYLHPEGSIHNLTQAQFIQQAQQQDTQFGDVLSFNPDVIDIPNSEKTSASFKESVDIGRAKARNYTVNLTFQKIGSNWYITDFNRI